MLVISKKYGADTFFVLHLYMIYSADADKGPVVNSGIDFGLQSNIALALVKEMFKEKTEGKDVIHPAFFSVIQV